MAAVELDIFSGRPNPSWEVADAEVRRWLTTMNAHSQPVCSAPALGYRGVIVHLNDDQIRVFGGTASGSSGVLTDASRQFEKWLLSTGEKVADRKLLDAIRVTLP